MYVSSFSRHCLKHTIFSASFLYAYSQLLRFRSPREVIDINEEQLQPYTYYSPKLFMLIPIQMQKSGRKQNLIKIKTKSKEIN